MKFSCYQVNIQHRNQNNQKSQWKISEAEELEIFVAGLLNKWCDQTKMKIWSLPKQVGSFLQIGVERQSIGGSTKLYMAKFTCDHNGTWHGFPVSSKSVQDQPSEELMDVWYKMGLIDKSFRNKWSQGKI